MDYKVGGIIFNYDNEYVLAQIIDGKYHPFYPNINLPDKYHPLLSIIKGFYDEFGEHLSCWSHIIKYNNCDYYKISVDLEYYYRNLDHNYDVININDINDLDCDNIFKELIFKISSKK